MGIKINLATSSKHSRSTLKVILGLTLLLAGFLTIGWIAKSDIAQANTLNSRAERIFQYDRSHPNKLSNSEITKLSVALGFGDHQGAKILISRLEKQI